MKKRKWDNPTVILELVLIGEGHGFSSTIFPKTRKNCAGGQLRRYARQEILTQLAGKFAEKTCTYPMKKCSYFQNITDGIISAVRFSYLRSSNISSADIFVTSEPSP